MKRPLMAFYPLTEKTFEKSLFAPFARSKNYGFTAFNSLYIAVPWGEVLDSRFFASFNLVRFYDVQPQIRYVTVQFIGKLSTHMIELSRIDKIFILAIINHVNHMKGNRYNIILTEQIHFMIKEATRFISSFIGDYCG